MRRSRLLNRTSSELLHAGGQDGVRGPHLRWMESFPSVMSARLAAVAATVILIVACSVEAAPSVTPRCPVTTPNGETPPGEQPNDFHHGEDGLWTVLWPDGTVVPLPPQIGPNGSVELKWPWWRGHNATGALHIEGRRLDGEAPTLGAVVDPGYGDTGFQPTGLTFPADGCWEIRATAGGSSLIVVQEVAKPQ